MIADIIQKLIEKKDLAEVETSYVFDKLMTGEVPDVEAASFLTALQMKTPTDNEIISAVKVIRRRCVKINPGEGITVDTCGTGADNSGTFNISTAASFVVAGAGIKVAKHGNRSASSKCGSADVLESLGVNINAAPEKSEKALEEVGICFLFAPIYHPSFRNVAKVRKELGYRTIFNILGPLCNPAGVTHQVIGVYDASMTEKIAEVLEKTGTTRALVINSDGMDEFSTAQKTKITELRDGQVTTYFFDPRGFGFSPEKDIQGGNAQENSQMILDVLNGARGARRDVVVLNAAAAIYVCGKSDSIEGGIKIAERSIDSGSALMKLRQLIEVSR